MSSNAPLTAVLQDLASIKSALRGLYVTWCIGGPSLEASSALAAMAQEEGGHRRILERLAGGVSPDEVGTELIGVAEIDSWPDLVGSAGPVEIALAAVLAGLRESEDPEVRRNLSKMAVEERYHADFYLGWFTELERNDNEAGRLFLAAKKAGDDRVSDWLAGRREDLEALGLAVSSADVALDATATLAGTPCVHCGSTSTTVTSTFGTSLMGALMRCQACESQFEAIRHREWSR